MRSISEIERLVGHLSAQLFGKQFRFRVERDNRQPVTGRIFLQVVYDDSCRKSGEVQEWHGRKWYLSDHMTEDEIVKTAYAAFKATVEHEIMEGFAFDGKVVFNPHVDFRELVAVSDREVWRDPS